MKNRNLFLFSFFLLLLAPKMNAEGIPNPEESQTIGRFVPTDLKFFNENGSRESLSFGLPIILSPIFTGCQATCPILTKNLEESLKAVGAVGKDFQVISFSFDPGETSESLQNFRRELRLAPEWKTFRADPISTERLLTAIDFHFVKIADHMFAHPNLIVILSPSGKVIRYEYGTQFDSKKLRDDLKRARLGTPTRQSWLGLIFFLCSIGAGLSIFVLVNTLSRKKVPGEIM